MNKRSKKIYKEYEILIKFNFLMLMLKWVILFNYYMFEIQVVKVVGFLKSYEKVKFCVFIYCFKLYGID